MCAFKSSASISSIFRICSVQFIVLDRILPPYDIFLRYVSNHLALLKSNYGFQHRPEAELLTGDIKLLTQA